MPPPAASKPAPKSDHLWRGVQKTEKLTGVAVSFVLVDYFCRLSHLQSRHFPDIVYRGCMWERKCCCRYIQLLFSARPLRKFPEKVSVSPMREYSRHMPGSNYRSLYFKTALMSNWNLKVNTQASWASWSVTINRNQQTTILVMASISFLSPSSQRWGFVELFFFSSSNTRFNIFGCGLLDMLDTSAWPLNNWTNPHAVKHGHRLYAKILDLVYAHNSQVQ